jgi:uncharacterized membrane protein YidH (DUF202 family)
MGRLQLLGSYLGGRLPWWWHVGNGLILWLAIVVGAGAPNFNRQGPDLKRTMVMVVLILVGHTILAGAVVLVRWRQAQHEDSSLRPSRDH